jgi:hypothetical protein
MCVDASMRFIRDSQYSRASSELRMLLARAALANLRPPLAPLRRRLARAAMSHEAVVSVTEVHATRWLRYAVQHAAGVVQLHAEPPLSQAQQHQVHRRGGRRTGACFP